MKTPRPPEVAPQTPTAIDVGIPGSSTTENGIADSPVVSSIGSAYAGPGAGVTPGVIRRTRWWPARPTHSTEPSSDRASGCGSLPTGTIDVTAAATGSTVTIELGCDT